jgi:hypothetical protein
MYTKALRTTYLNTYSCLKGMLSSTTCTANIHLGYLRFQYPLEYNQPKIRTQFPGPKHQEALKDVQVYAQDEQYTVSDLEKFIESISLRGLWTSRRARATTWLTLMAT